MTGAWWVEHEVPIPVGVNGALLSFKDDVDCACADGRQCWTARGDWTAFADAFCCARGNPSSVDDQCPSRCRSRGLPVPDYTDVYTWQRGDAVYRPGPEQRHG